MLDEERTILRATWTTEGLIRHRKHPLGFHMPVKLAVGEPMYELQPPLRDEGGQLLFALPGGGVHG